MQRIAGYAGHKPQFWEAPPARKKKGLNAGRSASCRSAASCASSVPGRARSSALRGAGAASVSAPPSASSCSAQQHLLKQQRQGEVLLRKCSTLPSDYIGIMERQPGSQAGALPPPSKSAAVPALDRICGRERGRTVQDTFVNKVMAQVGPAVVRIDTERKRPEPTGLEAELFSFFFGGRPEETGKVEGHGSGFCVESSGIILTNAHVVQGQDRIFVTFPDGLKLEAAVLGADEVIDLAALHVAPPAGSKLPSIRLGSSSGLRVGDWAIACGNPFGLNNSCTLGIISSLDRSTGETGWDWMRHPLIQTDAAVNQGNSGGPLLNESGDAIGVVSMRALFGEGIAFAIPADGIKQCLRSLLKREEVPHAYLGAKLSALADGERGVMVQTVIPGTPADQAGLSNGDVIEELDGRALQRVDEVQRIVRGLKPGKAVTLKLRRGDGKPSQVKVTAGDVKHLKQVREHAAKRLEGKKPHRTIVLLPPR